MVPPPSSPSSGGDPNHNRLSFESYQIKQRKMDDTTDNDSAVTVPITIQESHLPTKKRFLKTHRKTTATITPINITPKSTLHSGSPNRGKATSPSQRWKIVKTNISPHIVEAIDLTMEDRPPIPSLKIYRNGNSATEKNSRWVPYKASSLVSSNQSPRNIDNVKAPNDTSNVTRKEHYDQNKDPYSTPQIPTKENSSAILEVDSMHVPPKPLENNNVNAQGGRRVEDPTSSKATALQQPQISPCSDGSDVQLPLLEPFSKIPNNDAGKNTSPPVLIPEGTVSVPISISQEQRKFAKGILHYKIPLKSKSKRNDTPSGTSAQSVPISQVKEAQSIPGRVGHQMSPESEESRKNKLQRVQNSLKGVSRTESRSDVKHGSNLEPTKASRTNTKSNASGVSPTRRRKRRGRRANVSTFASSGSPKFGENVERKLEEAFQKIYPEKLSPSEVWKLVDETHLDRTKINLWFLHRRKRKEAEDVDELISPSTSREGRGSVNRTSNCNLVEEEAQPIVEELIAFPPTIIKFIKSSAERTSDKEILKRDLEKVQHFPLSIFKRILNTKFTEKAHKLFKLGSSDDDPHRKTTLFKETKRLLACHIQDPFSNEQAQEISRWKHKFMKEKEEENGLSHENVKHICDSCVFPWILPFMYGRTTTQNGRYLCLVVAVLDLCHLANRTNTKMETGWEVPYYIT